MTTTSSLATIEKMRQMFATYGLRETIVTDNGPSFTSSEFREYMKENGVVLVNPAPYHPASNGLAERAVQTFKEGMKKMQSEGGRLEARFARFLFSYRATSQTTTWVNDETLMALQAESTTP